MRLQHRSLIQHLTLLILTVTLTLIGCNTTTRIPTFHTPTNQSYAEKNYNQLNQALPFYQAAVQNPWPVIPGNKPLKLGSKNTVVPMLRDRLYRSGDLAPTQNRSSYRFDRALANAVKSFQLRHGLNPTGTVNEQTLAELNVPAQERVNQIQASMQRFAQLSHKLGHRYIMVNIPEYQMVLVDDDKKVLTMKAIVGKPTRQTPELYSRLTRLVFNPYWRVPTKIAKDDILPKIQNDPEYLESMNMKVLEHDRDKPIDDSSIDWDAVNPDQDLDFDFRQEPGDKNALGVVKFEFPNPYDVYMHDTPAKELFNTYPRAFSSGCIRLEKPFALVDYLIKENPSWNNERIQQVLQSKQTTYVSIIKPIPIVITYITAWVDETGKINFRNDIYQRASNNALTRT